MKSLSLLLEGIFDDALGSSMESTALLHSDVFREKWLERIKYWGDKKRDSLKLSYTNNVLDIRFESPRYLLWLENPIPLADLDPNIKEFVCSEIQFILDNGRQDKSDIELTPRYFGRVMRLNGPQFYVNSVKDMTFISSVTGANLVANRIIFNNCSYIQNCHFSKFLTLTLYNSDMPSLQNVDLGDIKCLEVHVDDISKFDNLLDQIYDKDNAPQLYIPSTQTPYKHSADIPTSRRISLAIRQRVDYQTEACVVPKIKTIDDFFKVIGWNINNFKNISTIAIHFDGSRGVNCVLHINKRGSGDQITMTRVQPYKGTIKGWQMYWLAN